MGGAIEPHRLVESSTGCNRKNRCADIIFRVLRKGGRADISDIVADEEVPVSMQSNPELWSGCVSGALTEEGFLKAFADAGFYGIQILKRDERRGAPSKASSSVPSPFRRSRANKARASSAISP